MNATNTQVEKGPYELMDVDEVVSIYGREMEVKLEGLIEEALQRGGAIDPARGEHVVIPAGELIVECDDQRCYYGTGFEVFDGTGRRILMIGRAAGAMVPRDAEGTYEIHDLEIYSLHHY
jgi:hypothetical protein